MAQRGGRRRDRRQHDDVGGFTVEETITTEQLEELGHVLKLSEFKKLPVAKVLEQGQQLGLESLSRARKQDIIFSVLKAHANEGASIYAEGVLEILQDGFGFLRSADESYLAGPDDIYVAPGQIRRFNLRTGDTLAALVRPPLDNERYFALLKVHQINFEAPEKSQGKVLFENLTPLFPQERYSLEQGNGSTEDLTSRIIDMAAPVGKGQRGLIVSPPKAGKTMLLQNIAQSIAANYPETFLIVLLIDERPEEVTEMQRTVRGEVVSSTFDEPATRHVQVAEMVLHKARRLAEHRRDVVILLDSITRLARAYNTVTPVLRAGAVRWRGGQRATSSQALLRRGAQDRGRRQPDDSRHRAGRYRLEDGRGDLRGVQGHRQLRDPPGPADFREARLPRHQHQPLGHTA